MIVILSFCVVFLVALVMRLYMKMQQQKRAFKYNVKALQEIIVELSKKQKEDQDRLQLANELIGTIKSARENLNTSIVDLNHELLDLLSKNNLLK